VSAKLTDEGSRRGGLLARLIDEEFERASYDANERDRPEQSPDEEQRTSVESSDADRPEPSERHQGASNSSTNDNYYQGGEIRQKVH
jgi:hypothetical protein